MNLTTTSRSDITSLGLSGAFGSGISTSLPRSEALHMDRPATGGSRYELVDTLGEGGMGAVDLVRDHDIDRLVAVKRLKRSELEEHVQRFAGEVRCLGRLEHPGIVPVHDVGRDEDGTYFLVMKHLQGETMAALISRLASGDRDAHERFPISERVRICDAILRIMTYAHQQGVVHRDLKPSNIMIGEHGEVTILDWGLAKHSDVGASSGRSGRHGRSGDWSSIDTRASSLVGTPLYMSPEQAQGADEVDAASDLYSMAVMFYELLTLEHYLAGLSDMEILGGVISRRPRLAYWVTREDQPRVPIELAYWLRRGLEKRKEDRFQDADEMRAELQRTSDGKFDVVCPTTLSRRVFHCGMETANRRPVLMLVALAVAALLAIVGAVDLIT